MTYGDLKTLVRRSRRHGGAGGMSIVNPSFTKDQALDIFEKALRPYPDEAVVDSSRSFLLSRNIMRECQV
jgi:hypothetical protein